MLSKKKCQRIKRWRISIKDSKKTDSKHSNPECKENRNTTAIGAHSHSSKTISWIFSQSLFSFLLEVETTAKVICTTAIITKFNDIRLAFTFNIVQSTTVDGEKIPNCKRQPPVAFSWWPFCQTTKMERYKIPYFIPNSAEMAWKIPPPTYIIKKTASTAS